MKNTKAKDFAYTIEEFKLLLYDAQNNAVSEWEMNFVEDIKHRFENYNIEIFFTEAQNVKLMKIAKW